SIVESRESQVLHRGAPGLTLHTGTRAGRLAHRGDHPRDTGTVCRWYTGARRRGDTPRRRGRCWRTRGRCRRRFAGQRAAQGQVVDAADPPQAESPWPTSIAGRSRLASSTMLSRCAARGLRSMRLVFMPRTASSRAAYAGAVLVTVLVSVAGAAVPLPPQPAGVPYPTEAWPVAPPGPGVDVERLDAALDAAFELRGWNGLPDTRALLVVHHGALVAERYAQGFGPDSRFQSWSMAKTVTQALVGILVGQKRLDLRAAAPVPAWRAKDDPRGAITLDQLLHMTSGLDNADGSPEPDSFASRLLFGPGSLDVFAYASNVPAINAPDTSWAYSTGTTMIV